MVLDKLLMEDLGDGHILPLLYSDILLVKYNTSSSWLHGLLFVSKSEELQTTYLVSFLVHPTHSFMQQL